MTILKNGTLVTPEGLKMADLAMTDDKITAIGENLPVCEGDTVVDVSGCVVFPGFIDGIMQNIYLYCAAYNLNTVVCGSFKPADWAKELKLPANKYVILTQVVGCPR